MKPKKSFKRLRRFCFIIPLFLIVFNYFPDSIQCQTISLGEAVDNDSLTWTTGGDADWFGQTEIFYYDGDAAQSGIINEGQSSWIETTVAGPVVLSFALKWISNGSGYHLTIYFDGEEMSSSFYRDYTWEIKTIYIPSGAHAIRWDFGRYYNNPPANDDIAVFLDQVELISPIPLRDALDNTDLEWTTKEDVGWFGQNKISYDGEDAAQSGCENWSWIETKTLGPGILSFLLKDDKVNVGDAFEIYINGIKRYEERGTYEWRDYTISMPSGNDTIRWVYGVANHRGFLDQVEFTPTLPLSEVLDDSTLTWTTGIPAWFGQSEISFFNGSAACSGKPDGGWIETKVTGPGILSFYWKVSGFFEWQDLDFYINNTIMSECTNDKNWMFKIYQIPSGEHDLKWVFTVKDFDEEVVGFLDKVMFNEGPQGPTLGEALDNPLLTWTTGGDADWFGQNAVYYYGEDAAKGGNINEDQSSWIETMVAGPGILLFHQSGYLNFYIDDHAPSSSDQRLESEESWFQYTYVISQGNHKLRWEGSNLLDKVMFMEGPSLMVTAPNGGETWFENDFSTSIDWIGNEEAGEKVKLELVQEDNLKLTITDSTENNGHYDWNLPLNLSKPPGMVPGSDYRIKILAISDTSIYDYSDSCFTIARFPSMSFGGFLSLDGIDDYACSPDHAELDIGSEADEDFTIETWVNIKDWDNIYKFGPAVIVEKPNAYRLSTHYYFDPVRLAYPKYLKLEVFFNGGFSSIEAEQPYYFHGALWTHGWHHLAAVMNKTDSTICLYIDGKRIAESIDIGPIKINNSTDSLRVGRFLGSEMDELRISNIARYSGGTYQVPLSPFECDAYTRALWHFDEKDGSTEFNDSCGEDNLLFAFNSAQSEGTKVDPLIIMPQKYQLLQNYPNPFNSSTTIKYTLTRSTKVSLQVYNILGELVSTLVEKYQLPGDYAVIWNGKNKNESDSVSGLYFYYFKTDGFVKCGKMILTR